MRVVWSYNGQISAQNTLTDSNLRTALLLDCSSLSWKKYRPDDYLVLYLDCSLFNYKLTCIKLGYLGAFDEIVFFNFKEFEGKAGSMWAWPKILINSLQTNPFISVDWDVFLNGPLEFDETAILTFPEFNYGDSVVEVLSKKYGMWYNGNFGVNGGLVYWPDANVSKFIYSQILQSSMTCTVEENDWYANVIREEVFINQVIKLFKLSRTTIPMGRNLGDSETVIHWIEGKLRNTEEVCEDLKKFRKNLIGHGRGQSIFV